MKKQLLIFFFLLLNILQVNATHIVGGGFNYRNLGQNQYRFTLTLYFDFINGNVGAKDRSVTCYIFRKSDNMYMDSLFMPLSDSTKFLNYSNPACSGIADLKTQLLTYSSNFFMSSQRYNSAAGYYIIWERCCRNHDISNIQQPNATGQTFYMEFPPVVRNGLDFVNSSPAFIPVSADFPCINHDFSLSFQATDADGDVLQYSLTNPLKGNSSQVIPRGVPPTPAPYAPVDWISGYSGSNPIPGNPGLAVNSQTGLLTCRASEQGLFVFSVKCEEFRNGQKIGEIRREMQVPVVDCPPNNPPVIVLNNPQGIRLGEDDTLNLETRDENFCNPIKISDLQENTSIRFRLSLVSGPAGVGDSSTYFTNNFLDSASARFCLPACAVTPAGQPWKVRLIASDNGCAESASDTLTLFINIRRSAFQAPLISVTGTQPPDTIRLIQNQLFSLPLIAAQNQTAKIKLESRIILEDGQVLTSWPGIILPQGTGFGLLEKTIGIGAMCRIPGNGRFRVETIVIASRCQDTLRDTLTQYFNIKPDIPMLRIFSDWQGGDSIVLAEKGRISFTVTAEITDGSEIYLLPSGPLSFEPGFRFDAPQSGFGKISGLCSFEASCEGSGGIFDLRFTTRGQVCDSVMLKSLSYRFNLQYNPDTIGIPPNLITCNADGRNDYFSLEKITSGEGCYAEFDFVEIFNRWGKRVFLDSNKDFRWVPDSFSEGLYYYCLHFRRRKAVNGWLRIVKE